MVQSVTFAMVVLMLSEWFCLANSEKHVLDWYDLTNINRQLSLAEE